MQVIQIEREALRVFTQNLDRELSSGLQILSLPLNLVWDHINQAEDIAFLHKSEDRLVALHHDPSNALSHEEDLLHQLSFEEAVLVLSPEPRLQ